MDNKKWYQLKGSLFLTILLPVPIIIGTIFVCNAMSKNDYSVRTIMLLCMTISIFILFVWNYLKGD